MYVIRKRIKLPPEKGIFLFSNNKMPPTGYIISQMYETNKDEDQAFFEEELAEELQEKRFGRLSLEEY